MLFKLNNLNVYFFPTLRVLVLCSLISLSFKSVSEVIQKEYINHYFVTPEDGKSLRLSLKEASPIVRNGRTFYGKTEWSVYPNYRYKDYGSLCVIKDIEVQLNVKFVLPKLHYTETPAAAVINQFNQFYEALYQHELGHKELGVKAANAVKKQMKSLEPYGNCHDLNAELKTIIQQTIKKYMTLNRQYDVDTNYGMTQGAVIKDVILKE